MDDTPAKENPAKDFNKLDLSQLQGFSFGTQWAQDKTSPSDRADSRGDRPPREGGDRRDGPRDRRAFRRPSGPGAPAGAPAGEGERREPAGDRRSTGDRRQGGYTGGPRRDDRGPRQGDALDRGPYDSPYFSATFYPEDTSFNALAKTIRSSCRTIELFEIARTVIDKLDRFVVVLTRKPAAAAAPGAPEAKPAPLSISVPDGLPFESDEAAISHVLSQHLDRFFDRAEAEIEPPKGNFLVINKCTITGELLGPPNYHRYNQIVQQHHAAKIRGMSLEAYRSRIETLRDPEVVAQWLEKMKKTTRYTWKTASKPAKPAAESPAATEAAPAAEPVAAAPAETAPAESTPVESAAPAAPTAAPAEAPAAEPAEEALTFDTFEEARMYLLTNARDKVVRQADSARFHGKIAEQLPAGEIRRATEGALDRQRRFPLDTANALRGRLRRERFTIFKKGSKGISYVCAVKRKFRVPGQVFAESIGTLISFIEAHPMIRASELATKFLGLKLPEAAPAGDPATPLAPEPTLTLDERAKLSRMQGDLRWLVTEGYVTEFIDGRLFAPPPMAEARKKEAEAEEHDPENFPEAPASAAPCEGKAAPEPTETAPVPAAAPAPAAPDVAPEAPAPAAESPGSAS